MKKFSELMEKSGDTAVFTFGRMNPPTTGHGKLIDAMAREQKKNVGSKMHIFVSHSQDAKKNPLDYKRKVAYIRKMFPKYAKNVTTDKARTIFEVAVSLHNKGYKAIVMVVGSDRVDEFEKILNQYNGVDGRHGFYGFDNIEVVSAGERDPDAEGVEGMSASKMRAAATDGDLESFKQGVPSGFKDVEKLYRDVRKSMGIREEKDMGEMDIYEEMRDAYLTGKIWNVGEIIEAKGMRGEIVRKGTNYISFVTEDNKVHKAWLHEIELDEGPVSYVKALGRTAVDQTKAAVGSMNPVKKAKKAASALQRVGVKSLAKKAKSGVKSAVGTFDVGKKYQSNIKKAAKDAEKRAAAASASRVKKPKLTAFDKKVAAQQKRDAKKAAKAKKEEFELDEMAWFMRAKAKIDQMTHPKGFEKMVKQFADRMTKPENKKRNPSAVAADVAREFDVSARTFIQYTNKLVQKGVLPKELKAEYQTEDNQMPTDFKSLVLQMEKLRRVKQDPDVKDEPGTQPAKYYAGVKKSTKDDREAHFKRGAAMDDDNPAAYTPAPGDKGGKTKPSKHTKKFKQMFGEQKEDCPPATKDVALNTKNRNATRDNHMYGPLNVKEPGDYWEKLADKWDTTVEAAKKSKCGNCVAFDISPRMEECMPGSVSDESGRLGYCWMHHFKCHSARSCDTWATGGPIKEDKKSYEWQEKAFGKNEKLDKDADIGDYVKDFKKSDAPQFKGKSMKKRHKMAVAAYLSRNEALLDRVDELLTENGHTDVASMKVKVGIAYKALERMNAELSKLGDEAELPTWWTNKVATAVSRIDDMSDYLDYQVEGAYQLDEKIKGLVKKAEKSGMPYGVLKKVYDRGMAAWRTGHRPGTTPQQWAFARVNSFTTKSKGTWGGADKDLAKQVREVLDVDGEVDESLWANIAAKRKRIKAGSGEKMRKPGEKGAPTPAQMAKAKAASEEFEPKKKVNSELNEWGEIEEEAEYQGRKVTLNKPTKGDVKKSKVYVRNEKGNVVKVEFGDPNMEIKRDDPARRKSFRARHNCDNPGPKTKARYWSCKFWEKGKSVTDLMKG